MAKETILRKRLVSEGLPEKYGWYPTNIGERFYDTDGSGWNLAKQDESTVAWFLVEETAHVLSDDELDKYVDEKIDEFIEEMKEVVNLKYGKILAITTKQDEQQRNTDHIKP